MISAGEKIFTLCERLPECSNRNKAKAAGRRNGHVFLVEVEVDPGKCYDFDNGTHYMDAEKTNWASKGYDSATAQHPEWDGVSDFPFTEYCIANPRRITIIRAGQLWITQDHRSRAEGSVSVSVFSPSFPLLIR